MVVRFNVCFDAFENSKKPAKEDVGSPPKSKPTKPASKLADGDSPLV